MTYAVEPARERKHMFAVDPTQQDDEQCTSGRVKSDITVLLSEMIDQSLIVSHDRVVWFISGRSKIALSYGVSAKMYPHFISGFAEMSLALETNRSFYLLPKVVALPIPALADDL